MRTILECRDDLCNKPWQVRCMVEIAQKQDRLQVNWAAVFLVDEKPTPEKVSELQDTAMQAFFRDITLAAYKEITAGIDIPEPPR